MKYVQYKCNSLEAFGILERHPLFLPFVHPLSIFGGFLRVQHPPTAKTHIILTEDKSVPVKCVAYAHVDHQVYRGRRMHAGMHAGMHGQAFVHRKKHRGCLTNKY